MLLNLWQSNEIAGDPGTESSEHARANEQGGEHMANSDPWLGINWKVYAVQGPGGDYLKPDGKQVLSP